MSTTLLIRKLAALECPIEVNAEDDFDLESQKFQNLVVWLEDQKIRLLSAKERKPLKKFEDMEVWTEFLQKYLEELKVNKYPELKLRGYGLLKSSKILREGIIEALSDQALFDEYIDAEEGGLIENCEGDMESDPPHAEDRPSDLLCEVLNEVLRDLELPVLHAPDATWSKVLSVLDAIRVNQSYDIDRPATDLWVLADSASGVREDDSVLTKIATICRLLHCSSLRNLQSAINRVICEMQEISGDPKTNVLSGRVGR